MQHHYQDLIEIFHRTFFDEYNTRLIKGDDEPIYLPANEDVGHHRIIFAHGYYASALHEVAHWCIAGPARQLKQDWGYWYLPDGRNEKQQARFEQVEVKPQAVEWAFCIAANFRFNVSADNLNGCGSDWRAFRHRVHAQLTQYFEQGFPLRAQMFIDALMELYRPGDVWSASLLTEQEASFLDK